jgi:hypothetical protein
MLWHYFPKNTRLVKHGMALRRLLYAGYSSSTMRGLSPVPQMTQNEAAIYLARTYRVSEFVIAA